MTTYYKKVNLNINHYDFEIDEIIGDKLFEYKDNLGYFQIKDDRINKIFSNVFKIQPKQTFLVQAKSEINPHKDRGVHSCLNYYLRPGEFTTNFWIKKENVSPLGKDVYFNKTTNKYEPGFDKNDLILVDSFTAHKNDTCILNIGEIHSVDGPKKEEPRTLIQFQWHMKIDELLSRLEF